MKTVVLAILFFARCSRCSEYYISECPTGRLEYFVDSGDVDLTCHQSPVSKDRVFWSIQHESEDSMAAIGTCPGASSDPCTVYHKYSDFVNITRTRNGVRLTGKLTGRHKSSLAGTLQCKGYNGNQSTPAATCNVSVTDCHVTGDTSLDNSQEPRTMSGWCTVDNKFATGQSCHIANPIRGNWLTGQLQTVTTLDDTGIGHETVRCSFARLPLPAEPKFRYTIWNVHSSKYHPGENFTIEKPGKPTLSNCPREIRVGDKRTCICQPAAASPPATVTWYAQVSEDSGVLRLSIANPPNNETVHYRCTQYWMNSTKDVTYSVRIISEQRTTARAATSTTTTAMITTAATTMTTATRTTITTTTTKAKTTARTAEITEITTPGTPEITTPRMMTKTTNLRAMTKTTTPSAMTKTVTPTTKASTKTASEVNGNSTQLTREGDEDGEGNDGVRNEDSSDIGNVTTPTAMTKTATPRAMTITTSKAMTRATTPRVMTKKTPRVMTKTTPRAMTKTTPRAMRKTTPRAMTKTTPRVMTKTTPRAMTKITPRAMTKTTPRAMTKTTPRAMTKTTPRALTKTTPRAMTKTTPRALTKTTPRVMTKTPTPTLTTKTSTKTTSEVNGNSTQRTREGDEDGEGNDGVRDEDTSDTGSVVAMAIVAPVIIVIILVIIFVIYREVSARRKKKTTVNDAADVENVQLQ